jgi:hypothetical protein
MGADPDECRDVLTAIQAARIQPTADTGEGREPASANVREYRREGGKSSESPTGAEPRDRSTAN